MSGVLSEASARVESRPIFERLYADYNKRIYVSPDPLQFLYGYDDPADREIVGLLAASLAYGRVAQILKDVERVLAVLGPRPARYLAHAERDGLTESLCGFVHRFTDCGCMVDFLCAVRDASRKHGSLENLFLAGYSGDTREAMERFSAELTNGCGTFLLPLPSKGSACKRLALFLRWMVRRDEVDPGGWRKITPDALFVPLDTHMFNICSTLGLCSRKSADGRAAAEITEAFRDVCPEDPVKYDFALTRFGIRSDMTVAELFARWK